MESALWIPRETECSRKEDLGGLVDLLVPYRDEKLSLGRWFLLLNILS